VAAGATLDCCDLYKYATTAALPSRLIPSRARRETQKRNEMNWGVERGKWNVVLQASSEPVLNKYVCYDGNRRISLDGRVRTDDIVTGCNRVSSLHGYLVRTDRYSSNCDDVVSCNSSYYATEFRLPRRAGVGSFLIS
jgi:hypothetical protein